MGEARFDAIGVFGARVRDERQAQGMTQEELAHACEMHTTNVGKLERGAANPSLLTMVRLAAALDADLGVLLAGVPARRDTDEVPRLLA